MEDPVYTSPMPRKPRRPRGPRPKQGAHLLRLRKTAGLTQAELADAVGVPQQTVAYWETGSTPPRSDVLAKMASALGVRVEDILVDSKPDTLARRSGPVGEVQKVFEEVRSLPRKQQRKVVEIVTALVAQYRRKAS